MLYCTWRPSDLTTGLHGQVHVQQHHTRVSDKHDQKAHSLALFGRQFVKQFAPWDHCLSCRSVCNIGILWANGWIDQDATWYRGRPHRVRWGPTSPPQKGHSSPHFSAHVYCGHTAGWIRIPLGSEVGLSPGHFVLDGDPAPLGKGHSSPHISAHIYWGEMVAHLSNCWALVWVYPCQLHHADQTEVCSRQLDWTAETMLIKFGSCSWQTLTCNVSDLNLYLLPSAETAEVQSDKHLSVWIHQFHHNNIHHQCFSITVIYTLMGHFYYLS